MSSHKPGVRGGLGPADWGEAVVEELNSELGRYGIVLGGRVVCWGEDCGVLDLLLGGLRGEVRRGLDAWEECAYLLD